MSKSLAARNDLVNWQVAPAEHEIANYDKPKIEYRRYVEEMIQTLPTRSIRKKPFFTISVNVLCADTTTSKSSNDPIERDLYLPLEIAITKWSLVHGKIPADERDLLVKVWMINPGPPTRGCVCAALEHRKHHKIEFDPNDMQNSYVEQDLDKVMKEINSFLTADRTVFSLALKHTRQDLGALKWLNIKTGCKSKPIKVYSLEDLHTVLIRRLKPDCANFIGQGFARHRLNTANSYDTNLLCDYHETIAQQEEGECRYCACALSLSCTNIIIDDVVEFGQIFTEIEDQTKCG